MRFWDALKERKDLPREIRFGSVPGCLSLAVVVTNGREELEQAETVRPCPPSKATHARLMVGRREDLLDCLLLTPHQAQHTTHKSLAELR
jgi:hypothetical protein